MFGEFVEIVVGVPGVGPIDVEPPEHGVRDAHATSEVTDGVTVRPSGASLQLALDIGKYVNSFTWRGDPPR